MDEVKVLTTLEEARAISDPYRYRILKCFYEINEPATAKKIADMMGEVPAKVHYHVKKLLRAGILILVYTKEINGIMAKYYEPTAKSFDVFYNKSRSDNKEVVLKESEQLISELYDKSKRILLNKLKSSADDDKKLNATFEMDDLYLSEKEAEELKKYISEYFKEHGLKSSEDDRVYHCFFSIGQI